MTRIQMRRDTSTNWSVNNPTPANGEPCYETDTRKFKIGDGVTKYTSLPYQGGGGGGGATIDDSTTATTSVWSSSKTNTEITTVANEVVQVQGDVASLDGDVSTLKTDVSGLKTNKQDKLVAGDNITIDPETNTISATGGGSTPANMVTTDTVQDITANKTFYGEIRVGADNNYATLAKFSKEALVSGNSTLSEHIDLGEADFVVQGNLGKKVYETDKYVYKKYINVDDLSDNQIKMDNSISSQVAHMAMPSDKYIDLTLGASGTTYTAPADGWFILTIANTGGANVVADLTNRTNGLKGTAFNSVGWGASAVISVKKNNVVTAAYVIQGTEAVKALRFIYAVGSEPVV